MIEICKRDWSLESEIDLQIVIEIFTRTQWIAIPDFIMTILVSGRFSNEDTTDDNGFTVGIHDELINVSSNAHTYADTSRYNLMFENKANTKGGTVLKRRRPP